MRRTLLLLASMALAVVLACAVASVEAVRPAQAAFPGTNGKIVLDGGVSYPPCVGLTLINPDGSGQTTLGTGCRAEDPAMSPNGTRVAYSRGQYQNSEIFKINVNNRKSTQITNNEKYDGDPTWSPDGTRIAFVRGERGEGRDRFTIKNTDIFVRRADGTGKTVNLTKTPNEDERAPAWSPNGKEIAFHIGGSQHYWDATDVFVQNLDTGQRRNLTNDGTSYSDYRPSWSPDGTRIVFESYAPDFGHPSNCCEVNRISTMNASDGSDRRLLAETWHEPAWTGSYFVGTTYSPDGRKIAYGQTLVDYDDTTSRVNTMNASDGSNKQRIYGAPVSLDPFSKDFYVQSFDWGVKVRR